MSQYTSESEFRLDKRVHMTNEIPPYDMYDALNSVVQTDLWKWVLGSTVVDFNLPYYVPKVSDDGNNIDYVHDIDSKEVYYKMVNGKLSKTYGPSPSENKNYHLLEEYGVLVPEFDFLLHEVYRYLDNLYPDHPDYTELLTNNEFNDNITAAAAIIDYKPDNKFFESLSESLGLSSYEAKREAAMIKIRNLRNESFRRKLYGSKAGYRMLANDIFQNATVFPVATYLPLKKVTKEQLEMEKEIYDNADKLGDWNSENGRKFSKEQFLEYNRKYNRTIDTYSKFYYKKFRLIDLDGSSSSYPEPRKTDINFFGFSIPLYEYSIIEYPTGMDTDSKIASVKANTFYSNNYDNITRYVDSVNEDRSVVEIKYSETPNEKGEHIEEKEITDEELHSINLTYSTVVPYSTGFVYPKFDEIIPKLTEKQIAGIETYYPFYGAVKPNESSSIFYHFYYGDGKIGFTSEDIDKIVKRVDIIYNPFIKDTLLLKPEDSLSYYPDLVTGDRDGNFTVANEVDINWNDKNVLKRGEYIADSLVSNSRDSIKSTVQVSNFTKGYIKFVPSGDNPIAKYSYNKNITSDDKYAIIIENAYGKDVLLFGSLRVEELPIKNQYQLVKARFNIAAIPNIKNEQILSVLYGDKYKNLVETKVYYDDKVNSSVGLDKELALAYLYGTEEESQEALKKMEEAEKDYTEFVGWVKKLTETENEIEDLAKNREYIFENYEITDKSGNKSTHQRSLIRVDSKIKRMLIGNVETSEDKEAPLVYGSFNLLGQNRITELSLGNLNVNPIYKYYDNSLEISKDTVKDAIAKVGNKDINYLIVNSDLENHDEMKILNISTGKYDTRNNYYKQSRSELDDYLRNYFSDNFSVGKENSTIKLRKRTDIKIESSIDISVIGNEKLIYFESDLSKELAKSLSVGDLVSGPSIDSDDNDIFITKIYDDYIEVNQPLKQSGKFILTYSVKANTTIDNLTDNVDVYKKTLYKNGLYSISNPFEHGLWPSRDFPRVSNALLDSLPDISFYEFYSYKPKDSINNIKSNQSILYDNCYYDEKEKDKLDPNWREYKYLLSDIKFNNELFLELNLNKLLNYKSKTGKSPILMSVDWLDYIENSLKYSSRATDNVKVGINLMMETDTTGYYTSIPNQSYTDPSIRLKFITLNIGDYPMWKELPLNSEDWTVPVYAQVGTGGQGRLNWFISPDDTTYPDIWGYDVYDRIKDKKEIEETSENGGKLRRVNLYGNGGLSKKINITSNIYRNVENPLFEIPLGEYDTTLKYIPKGSNIYNNSLTITQASFYAQTFSNLIKFFDAEEEIIRINGNDVTQSNLLNIFDYQKLSDIMEDTLPLNNFNYAGEWIPSERTLPNSSIEIVYPEDPSENTYYVVPRDVELNNIKFKYNASDIIFYKNERWHYKSFQFVSLLGDAYNNIAKEIFITPSSNLAPDKDFNLLERLLQYYLRTTRLDPDALDKVNKSNYTSLYEKIGELDENHKDDKIKFVNLGIEKEDTTKNCFVGSLMYFLYIDGITEDNEYSRYMKENQLDLHKGDRIVATVIDDKWYLFKINIKTLLGASVPVSIYMDCTKSEYDVITGINRNSKDDGIDFETTIDRLNSAIKLPRGYITDGSFKFNFTVDPRFIAKGYKYSKDESSINMNELVSFDITKGSIYYDNDNDNFYTFSNTYNNGEFNKDTEKIAIKFNEPKFFKNVLNTNCAYQVNNILKDGESVYRKTPTLSSIKGLNFDVNHISTGDRILEIKEINLRSLYSKNLEPIAYSNYTTLSYLLRGLQKNGDIILSYNQSLQDAPDKVKFANSLEKYRPTEYIDGVEEEVSFEDRGNILNYQSEDKYENPSLYSPRVSKSFINDANFGKDSIKRDFAYFKNNLVVKGTIDSNYPRKIIAPTEDSNLFLSALDLISKGDKVVDGYTLGGAFEETTLKVSFNHNNKPLDSLKIKRANFANKQLVVATKFGDIYFNESIELSSLGNTNIDVSKITLNTPDGSEIRDLVFDSKNKVWVVEVASKEVSNLYSLPPLSKELDGRIIDITSIYNNESKVYVDDGEKHILYGSSVDSLSKNEDKFDNTYIVNNIDEDYVELGNSVIENIGIRFEENEEGFNEKEDEKVFYKDISISTGRLTANRDSSNNLIGYKINNDPLEFNNEPYLVDNLSTPSLSADYDGRLLLSEASLSRSVITSDVSGRYSAYAKGRDLFIKSPTELVSYDDEEKVYKYNGKLSIESYWKHTKAPLFNDKNLLELTHSVIKNSAAAEELFKLSGCTALNELSSIKLDANYSEAVPIANQYISINGEPLTKEYQTQLDKMIEILVSFVGQDSGKADGSNIMSLDTFKGILEDKESRNILINKPKTDIIPSKAIIFFYDTINKEFVFRLKGFKIIEETIRDKNIATIGTYKQKLVSLEADAYTEIRVRDKGTLNISGSYALYLYYLDNFLFGNNANNEVSLSSNLNKLQFTDSGLFALDEFGSSYKISLSNLSKKSDIENPDNWIISSYPSNLCIKGRKNDLESKAYYKIGTDVFTLTQKNSFVNMPIFKPFTSYINENVILLGGYILSKNEIDRIFKNAYKNPDTGEINLSESQEAALKSLKDMSLYDRTSCPAIMYSIDGGVSYTQVNLLNKVTESIPSENIYINSIRFLKNEFRFYCTSTSGTTVTNNNIYYIPKNIDGEYDFANALMKALPDNEISKDTCYQIDVDATTCTDYDTNVNLSDIQNVTSQEIGIPEPTGLYRLFVTENSNFLELASSKSINLSDSIVTEKNLNSITLSNNIVPKGDSTIQVLISLYTTKDVPDNKSFLNVSKLGEIANNKGDLRIKEVTEVSDKNIANRLYSYRELIQNDAEKDNLGYPSLSEDTNHLFYKYNISKDSNGKDIYKPILLKNKFGNEVSLCTSDGKRLVYNDIDTKVLKTSNFSDSIYMPESFFNRAYQFAYESLDDIEDNRKLRDEDKSLTNLLSNKKILISDICFNIAKPFIRLSVGDTSILEASKDILFKYDETDTSFIDYLVNITGELKDGAKYSDISNIKYGAEGASKYTNETIGSSTESYWFNNEDGIFIIKNRRFLDSDVYISYSHKYGNTKFINPNLSKTTDKELYELPITGIYLSNYGYGGARNNKDLWKNILPWNLDKEAFTKEYLKNSNDNYIYLVDSNGSEIISNNSEHPDKVGETITLEKDIFSKGNNKNVSVYNLDGLGYNQEFYTRDTPKVEIYTPFNKIFLYKSNDFSSPLLLIKNSVILNDTVESLKINFFGIDRDGMKSYSDDEKTKDYLSIKGTSYNFKYTTDLVTKIPFKPENVGLSSIESIRIRYSYQGTDYENVIKVEFVDDENKRTPILKINDIIRFRKNKDNKTYRYLDFDFNKKEKIKDGTLKIDFDIKDKRKLSFINTSNFNSISSTVQFKSSTINSISFNINTSNREISSVETDYLSVSVENNGAASVFDIKLPVIDVGDIKTYHYNYINEAQEKELRHQFLLGDELWQKNIIFDSYETENDKILVKTIYHNTNGEDYTLDEDVIPKSMSPSSKEDIHYLDDIPYFLNAENGCVLYYNNYSLSLKIIKTKDSYSDDVIISGIKGKVICRKPKYNNFYELLNNEGVVIEGKTLSATADNRTSLANISLINRADSVITLEDMFQNLDELNDGEPHYLRLRALTQKTILTDASTANNEKYFEELDLRDIEKFTPDRIWYNPEGYPEPPIVIGNVIFNEANNINYQNKPFKNGNGFSVYRCNEKGKIIGYKLVDSKNFKVIKPSDVDYFVTDYNGNITYGAKEFELDRTMSLDKAQITRNPIYISCKEWFKNEFFLEGHESNPFWQVINISSNFNNTTKSWEQYAKVCEYKRATLSMALREVKEEDRYLNLSKSIFYQINDINIQKYDDKSFVDIREGVIRFLLNLPSSKYNNTKNFVKYGISAENSFYLDDSNSSSNKNVWLGKGIGLPVYLDSTYTVNSTKNLANPKDKDSDVKAVTELGLFNKYHQLIAYAVFPPIEYRTSSQHLSFTCYVKQGQLTDPSI